jgi:membrane-bound ClpP family serine protease
VDQVVQVVGALLILVAFAGVQFGRVDPRSLTYLWLNLVGSAILAVLAYVESQWGFLLLEGVWALVSAHGLIQASRSRRPGGVH